MAHRNETSSPSSFAAGSKRRRVTLMPQRAIELSVGPPPRDPASRQGFHNDPLRLLGGAARRRLPDKA